MEVTPQELVVAIASVGKDHPSYPFLSDIQPFQLFFLSDGSLNKDLLDERDGSCTRRELLLRFLLLNAVVDQGPDIIGVRVLLVQVTNNLYLQEVRFLHKPLSFFQELGISIDQIMAEHESLKDIRGPSWAEENQSSASKYNLFIDNSKQVLNYAVFRWGVPLLLPLLLEFDNANEESEPSVLSNYLESWESVEIMSRQLKDNERYGLGKAIGDKACHLFAKWMVSSFNLSRRSDPGWGPFSFEAPYDSNAGRVLWRTGYLLNWATEREYKSKSVIQPGAGKGGKDYIRVTNIRGMKPSTPIPPDMWDIYVQLAVDHLKTHKRSPRKVEIQRIQHVFLYETFSQASLGVAEFDEGLIHIGVNYCHNHSDPLCTKCPINELCEGYQSNYRLIDNFRT